MRISLTSLVLAIACQATAAAAGLYQEPLRPQFHFTPPQQWMNDPNGMVYDHGEYHLFYQYNPYANHWGPMHWGHAVSPDMVHWQNLPIALFPDRLGAIFSGSAVLDAANTSGFGTKSLPALVAMYTYHDQLAQNLGANGYQSQGLAWSVDGGRNWTKFPRNPVLKNSAVRDFRDPKVFWHAASHRWVVALAVGDHIAFYSSQNLKTWVHESDFGAGQGAHGGVWECPDLIEMRVEGTATARYVLLVSINPGGPNGGSATQFFVGNFDGHRFTAEASEDQAQPAAPRWIDYGTDDYAGSTWSGAARGDARVRFIGWMSNWQYANKVPTERWRSAMTLPRELKLVQSTRGLEVHSLPVSELQALRLRDHAIAAQPVHGEVSLTDLAGTNSGLLELELELDLKGAASAELRFENGHGEATVFRVDAAHRRYVLDRRTSGAVAFDPMFPALEAAPFGGSGKRVRLHVYLDQSSVEVFVNEGETVMTAVVFPSAPYDKITLGSSADTSLEGGHLYELKSIWGPTQP